MPKNKLVEEALIQMKNIEEAMAENAKGILASTMKEEISQLVKESLSEQEDDTEELDVTVDDDDMEDNQDDMEDNQDDSTEEDEMEFNVGDSTEDDENDFSDDIQMSGEDTIDLRNASDEDILTVFKAMGEDDGIIIKKDGEDIHLTDNNTDSKYLVKLGESLEENMDESYDEMEESYDEMEESYDEMEESYNEMDEEESVDNIIDNIFGEKSENNEEVVYEIEFDESDMEMDETEHLDESKDSKKSIKPKGVGIGSGPKFSYKKTTGGFKEDKKEGPKSVGTGKAKFEYKKGANLEGKSKIVKKTETKESARTLGNGSNFRKGGLPKPRAHSSANTAIKESVLQSEVSMLREKNEEYRKALNVFREKLNEVAIFNSNLAYATRLFTEHSTTKKEKINILRRFDGVETLKESKNLYKSIKEELSKGDTKTIKESVESKISKNVSTGSSTTLIESKTYENPQFLRMKDLMTKIG